MRNIVGNEYMSGWDIKLNRRLAALPYPNIYPRRTGKYCIAIFCVLKTAGSGTVSGNMAHRQVASRDFLQVAWVLAVNLFSIPLLPLLMPVQIPYVNISTYCRGYVDVGPG